MVREKNASAQRGFTLLELMTAIVVAVIVMAAAAPTFNNVLFNNRMTVSANEFTRFLQFARSEAVKARAAVQVGAKSGGTAWQSGWTVTVNGNTLKDQAALQFRGDGGLAGLTPVRFELCENRGGETGRQITVRPTGHIAVTELICSS